MTGPVTGPVTGRRAVVVAALATVAAAPPSAPALVQEYELSDGHGTTLRFIDYGATIVSLAVPDRAGRSANVVLGHERLSDYPLRNGNSRYGAVVGRYAGRIAGATFRLDGRRYRLVPNSGADALHGGGVPGTDAQRWRVRQWSRDRAELTLVSPDGAQGFPGRLTIRLRYRLIPGPALRIDYRATTTRATVLNLTNHSYFNLAGAGSGIVTGERLRIAADRWVEIDGRGIPTGRLPPVAGTPLDFRRPHAIGERIDVPMPPTGRKSGYDHGWLLRGRGLREAAWLADAASGRTLSVSTTEPSLQVYTLDHADGHDIGPGGRPIAPRDGVALETQHLADSPNRPGFPTTLLRPGRTFRSTTVWRFGLLPATPAASSGAGTPGPPRS